MWNGNFAVYNSDLFYVRTDGPVSGSVKRDGVFGSADVIICNRNSGNQSYMDIFDFPETSCTGRFVYFVSGILVCDNYLAGNLLLLCTETREKEIFKCTGLK